MPDDWVWRDDEDFLGSDLGSAIVRTNVDVDMTGQLVGKGTRHHTAVALSRRLTGALVITVSANGDVTIYKDGTIKELPSRLTVRFAP